ELVGGPSLPVAEERDEGGKLAAGGGEGREGRQPPGHRLARQRLRGGQARTEGGLAAGGGERRRLRLRVGSGGKRPRRPGDGGGVRRGGDPAARQGPHHEEERKGQPAPQRRRAVNPLDDLRL